MQFKLFETSVQTLHQSAVAAFPHTTMRQHATGSINIDNIRYTPFLGLRTLLVRCEADNQGSQYKPLILFRNVNYNPEDNIFEFDASDNGQHHQIGRLSRANTDVALRCECGDFFWRFNYYDHLDRSLYGRVRRPYIALYNPGSANPTESPGICKHLMKMAEVLENIGLLE